MKLKLVMFLSFFSFFSGFAQQPNVDMIIFSFDRPMQLYALLESIDTYVTGLSRIEVIYRSSNDQYQKGYDIVAQTFPQAQFTRQGSNPRADFKPLTEHALKRTGNEFVVFAVDDIVVKDDFDMLFCAKQLKQFGAYGFYFRLGFNLSECYMLNCKQPIPTGRQSGDIFEWTLANGSCDWGYPNTVDMTLYRKADILPVISSLTYHSPNTLEAHWHEQYRSVLHKKGICFTFSKIVNMPLNLVQQDYQGNRHMSEMSAAHLLEQFLSGNKIDISRLHKIHNKGAHMECCPTFIER